MRWLRFAPPAALVALAAASWVSRAAASTCVPPTVDWSKFPGGYQCIVGVQKFTQAEWGATMPATGGAPAKDGCAALGACLEWVDDLPDHAVWNRHDWGSVPAQAYDVLIFPPTATNAYGHAAVYDHEASGTVFVMDDNWDGNQSKSCAWAGHEGWVHSVTGYAPYGFYRLKSLEPPPPDKPPIGSLDAVACDTGLSGWSQDPDEPDKPTAVHLYFGGPAGSGAPAIPVTADVHRDDLCNAIGSCNHGFVLPVPVGMRDGQPHDVHAYGIDTNPSAANAELPGSPKAVDCPPPAAPFSPAIRRHVVDPASFSAWKLSYLTDVARFTDAMTAAVPAGADAPAAPKLVQADDGSPEVWLVDGALRRHVPSPASLAAWHLDAGAIVKTPAAEVNAMTQGPDWPEQAFSFESPDGAVYLLDVPPPAPPGSGGAGGAGSGAGAGGSPAAGAGGAGSNAMGTGGVAMADANRNGAQPSGDDGAIVGSCAARPAARTPGDGPGALAAGLALALAAARRRRRPVA
jgi:hypothetical protein